MSYIEANKSLTLNFAPYSEEAYPEIVPEYFIYVFNKTELSNDRVFDAQEGDVCLLGSMTPYLRWRPSIDSNTTQLTYTTGQFADGDYIVVVAAVEEANLSVMLPYKSVQFTIKSESSSSSKALSIIGMILFVVIIVAGIYYVRRVNKKKNDDYVQVNDAKPLGV